MGLEKIITGYMYQLVKASHWKILIKGMTY